MEAWKLPAASLAFQAVTNGTEGMAEDVIAAAGATQSYLVFDTEILKEQKGWS